MIKSRRALLLLTAAVLALILAGCTTAGDSAEPEPQGNNLDQTPPALPGPEDPEYGAYVLPPECWGKGKVLEGNLEMGYLMVGFNVPAGTSLYAPFDGKIGLVSLEDYSANSEPCEGLSLTAPGSLNGIYAYNVSGSADATVKAGDVFAQVTSEEYIFPRYYDKVNLILEFNLFDVEAKEYAQMRALFEKIMEHIVKA